jgi:hypothetical protein
MDAGAGAAAGASPATSLATKSPSFLSKSLQFVKDNPTATSLGLQAAGNLATSGSENAQNNAQTALLRQQYQNTEQDRQRRATLDAYLNRGLTLSPAVHPKGY